MKKPHAPSVQMLTPVVLVLFSKVSDVLGGPRDSERVHRQHGPSGDRAAHMWSDRLQVLSYRGTALQKPLPQEVRTEAFLLC